MAKLVWRLKLVAERHPGVTTKTELACIERDADVGLAELGLRLDEAKRLTTALQAKMVPAQMAALAECPRACEACGPRLAVKGRCQIDGWGAAEGLRLIRSSRWGCYADLLAPGAEHGGAPVNLKVPR